MTTLEGFQRGLGYHPSATSDKASSTPHSNREKRMIRIDITHTKNGGAIWSHDGINAKNLTNLARAILPTVGDAPWQAGREGKIDLTGKSLANLARFTATEGDKIGPKFVKWSPNPFFAKTEGEEP